MRAPTEPCKYGQMFMDIAKVADSPPGSNHVLNSDRTDHPEKISFCDISSFEICMSTLIHMAS